MKLGKKLALLTAFALAMASFALTGCGEDKKKEEAAAPAAQTEAAPAAPAEAAPAGGEAPAQ